MDLRVKNFILGKTFLSKFAFNHLHSLFAAVLDAADTLAFFHYHPTTKLITEIFQGMSKPSGKKTSLAWSEDGQYLALGAAHLEIWKLEGGRIAPAKHFT
jgi:hypothetical protein